MFRQQFQWFIYPRRGIEECGTARRRRESASTKGTISSNFKYLPSRAPSAWRVLVRPLSDWQSGTWRAIAPRLRWGPASGLSASVRVAGSSVDLPPACLSTANASSTRVVMSAGTSPCRCAAASRRMSALPAMAGAIGGSTGAGWCCWLYSGFPVLDGLDLSSRRLCTSPVRRRDRDGANILLWHARTADNRSRLPAAIHALARTHVARRCWPLLGAVARFDRTTGPFTNGLAIARGEICGHLSKRKLLDLDLLFRPVCHLKSHRHHLQPHHSAIRCPIFSSRRQLLNKRCD
jgi:hypothetical protein